MGQNPAVGAPNARLQRKAMSKLRWLVVRYMVEVESASWQYNSPEVHRGELNPAEVATEVFLFPAAGSAEKEGLQTNTQRLVQYRRKSVPPPGDARSESWFIHHLARRLKKRATADASPRNQALNALQWSYGEHGGAREPNVNEVVKEINGKNLLSGDQLSSFRDLKNDGTTSSGCWIYCGIHPTERLNIAALREPTD